MSEPILKRVVNGWAAYGKGWAVDGKTKEEALTRFHEAEEKHCEIDALPFTYDHTLLNIRSYKKGRVYHSSSS